MKKVKNSHNLSDCYKDDWHFKLIDNAEGVSLERIDPSGISQDENNWHSAASTAGYGTPTYKNSQYKLLTAIDATIQATPKVFSPDNDGRDDITTIQYEVTESGYIANITIFDAAGRVVYNQTITSNGTQQIETAKYQNGFYLMEGIPTDKKVIYSGKLNVMH